MLLLQTVMQFFSTKDVSHIFLSCNTKEIFCINVRKKVEERERGGGAIKINFVLNEQNAYAAMNAYADMLHYVYGKKTFVFGLVIATIICTREIFTLFSSNPVPRQFIRKISLYLFIIYLTI